MKITVLMATYEGERYIGQQLDSILVQTIPGQRTGPGRSWNDINSGIRGRSC
jgi:hypothetical protein